MKGKVKTIIILVTILLVGIVVANGCKKSTQAEPAAQTKAVEPNQP